VYKNYRFYIIKKLKNINLINRQLHIGLIVLQLIDSITLILAKKFLYLGTIFEPYKSKMNFMKSNIQLLFITIIIAIATQAYLVNPTWGQNKNKILFDPVADKILKNTNAKVNSLQDITASFKKTLYKSANSKEGIHYFGKIKLKKNKFYIDLDEQIIICNGKTMWSYLKKEKEVIISDYDPNEGFSPEKIFLFTQQDMRSKYETSENINGALADKVTMLPLSNKLDYFKIEVWVDKNKSLPSQLKIYNRSGSVVSYLITDLQWNRNLQDSNFEFNAQSYPGVEIIDNRN
jgi:outer membrane lipoprotein-sorting protein